MGIENYQSWLQSDFGPALLQGTPRGSRKPIHHAYVDLNCYLHTSVRQSSNADDYVRGTIHELNTLLSEFDDSLVTLTVAVDGPASRAKAATQRSRRRSTWGKQKDPEHKKLLTVGITPGTALMNELSRVLALYAKWLSKVRGVQILLMDGLLPGEGEHKLIAAIKENAAKFPGESHCIVGSDSDLFLIALGLGGKSTGGAFATTAGTRSGQALKQGYDLYTWNGERGRQRAQMFVRSKMEDLLMTKHFGLRGSGALPAVKQIDA